MQSAMQSAMMMAGIFGPFLVIMALWMLFYKANLMKVMTSLKTTPGILYVMGVINLLIGLTVLSQFHMWSMGGFSVLVTLLGWVVLLRGLAVFFMPQLLMGKKVTGSTYLKLKGIVMLVWGFLLCWFAFWM